MAEQPKKRTFKTFSYRGVDLEDLIVKPQEDVIAMFGARHRRKYARTLKRAEQNGTKEVDAIKRFLGKLVESRKGLAPGERPPTVKTHHRSLTIVPEMIGSIVGVYTGKTFVNVEIKPEMIGHYLGEFAFTYKPCFHGKAGSKSMLARFLPQ